MITLTSCTYNKSPARFLKAKNKKKSLGKSTQQHQHLPQ
ncbi:hypothetical protein O59_000328 [Cellvibrio sp. BR]|nr:hypothetical protein O59_000328 [Cellvibrio sp. BR]